MVSGGGGGERDLGHQARAPRRRADDLEPPPERLDAVGEPAQPTADGERRAADAVVGTSIRAARPSSRRDADGHVRRRRACLAAFVIASATT